MEIVSDVVVSLVIGLFGGFIATAILAICITLYDSIKGSENDKNRL